MDKQEAILKMEFLVAKGWTFEIAVDNTGWRCEAVGAGLAHGRGSDLFFEKAVALALKNASAMEDNPSVAIKKYRGVIQEALQETFGRVDFDISPVVQYWDGGPMRIEVRIKAIGDPNTMVDREMEFMRLLAKQPMEIFEALRIRFEWPEEQPVVK
jgi:hypothetical protein